MLIEFEQTSKKKRRWLLTHKQSGFPWLINDMYFQLENKLFEHNEHCRIIKEKTGPWYVMHVEFKNDSDEAAFILWASGGIQIDP